LPFTLEVGASCTLDYRFSPNVVGRASQLLAIESDRGDAYVILAGLGLEGSLRIAPELLAFGAVAVDAVSRVRTVTLTNTGSVPLQGTALTAARAPFARRGGSCGATLPFTLLGSETCTLDYTFSPVVSGPVSQELALASDAGNRVITLQGTGADAVGVPTLSQWAQLLLIGLVSIAGIARLRRIG
jgi:hypothetical protein